MNKEGQYSINEEKNSRSGFLNQVVKCLVSPRSVFKTILLRPSLRRATVIILVVGIITAWASYNYVGKAPSSLLEGLGGGPGFPMGPQGGQITTERLTQVLASMSAITGVIGVFGGWLISSALIHVLSRVLGEGGEFKNMLTLAGYASTPLLIQQPLRLIGSIALSAEEVQRLTLSFTGPALGDLNIFKVWSIALLAIATGENYKRSTVRSLLIVVVTYIITLFLPLI